MRAYLARVRTFGRDARLYLISSVLFGFLFSLQYLFFNLYLRSLGFGQDFMGILASIPALVTMVLALPAGFLVERIGYRRAMLLGAGLQGLAILGWCFLPLRPWMAGASLLAGIGGTLSWISGAPFLTEASEERERAHLFGVQAGLGVVAGVLGSVVGGFLPRVYSVLFGIAPEGPEAYQGVLLFAFGLLILAAIPILHIRAGQGRPPPRLREVLAHREVLFRLLLITGLIGLGAGLLMPFVNIFFKLRFGVPDPVLGSIFAANSLLMGLGNFSAPPLAERFGKVRTMVWSQAVSLPFLLLWGFGPGLGWSVAGYLVRTPLMNLAAPVFSLFSMELVPPRLRGGLSGVLLLSWNGGWALGSFASGFVQVRWGFTPLFSLTAILYALAILYTHRSFGSRGHPPGHHS